MRYISQHGDLILLQNDGTIAHRFGIDGVLNVGTLTTDVGASNVIDAAVQADTDDNIQRVYDDDLDGNVASCLEMIGQGSLDLSTDQGGASALTTLSEGNRLFYKAPTLSSGDNVANVDGVNYKVLSGTTIYDGTTYSKGETFQADGSVTTTSGTGTFRIDLTDELKAECTTDRAGLFHEKSLKSGDEPGAYWSFTDNGTDSRNSLTSTDSDYFGWTD